ncbi:hypothetical protein BDQ12DRAFT_675124 [Crucibulum laeve]|uniref:BHLH domain-containing protein n=1 Tax=Crucibulum laeve TaxID=68775 RepID=A0A5C3MHV1_9AGAR|nr:hypothetical protein BDQ12DRAFT_675124 [Crucibulum laeve]
MVDNADTNGNTSSSKSAPFSANGSSHRDSSPSKHSPIAPLAPLEYLQNQRRGSITDPSLHAAPTGIGLKPNSVYRQPPDQTGPASAQPSSFHDSNSKTNFSDPRPSSPYVFGDATVQPIQQSDTNSQLRKLLRSPSLEHSNHRPPSSLSHESHAASRNPSGPSNVSNLMNIDQDRPDQQNANRRSSREPQSFDYSMRRHSVAGIAGMQNQHTLPHLSSLPHGTKRKMSGDRGVFPPVGEEVDSQLVGPGVPSGMEVDTDAPAPKRRGSTFDPRSIAHLTLNDRRNSIDTRPGLQQQMWQNERRDSTSSMFSNVSSISGFNSVFPGDSPQGRLPPNIFPWQNNNQQQQQQQGEAPGNHTNEDNSNSRPFDPAMSAPIGMMPPMNFQADRRMSVPDILTTSSSSRALRSRSRPPSRQTQHTESNTQSGPSSGQEDSGAGLSPGSKSSKDAGATPYSRSPELRVSHKLAERKRRKEMKDLFDELRDQLPADRGMKASKWEILSKAIDFVAQLKQSHQDMAREIDLLRHEVETLRQGGNPAFPMPGPPPHQVVYGQVPGQFAPPPPPPGTMQPPQPPPLHPGSRPGSSQNLFSGVNPPPPSQNGNVHTPPT